MHRLHRRILTNAARLATLVALASCGNDGGPTTEPGKVVRVDVTAPTSNMEVGQNMVVTAKYFDASSSQLAGETITWTSTNTGVATVSQTGLVAAVGAGSTTINASVTGVTGTLTLTVTQVPVFFVLITPTNPNVRQGETATLVATPSNAIGQPLQGRSVTWATANPVRATITQGGVVTGVSPGFVYLRATSEGKVDSVNLRVRSLIPPTIASTSPAEIAPAASGTITGLNFGPQITDNEVYVNGAAATVTTASATSVTFTVPAKASLPCTATGPAQVILVSNGDSVITSMNLRVATARSLDVGASMLLTSQADLLCNEFTGSGGKYIITAFNYAGDPGARFSFRLTGTIPGIAAATATIAAPRLGTSSRAPWELDTPQSRHLRAHSTFLAQDHELARKLGNPKLRDRKRVAARAVGGAVAPALAPPAVGANLNYRMRRTINTYTTFDEVSFRVVYSGTKIVILEDAAAPLAGTMDTEYARLGEEFDQVMYNQLLAFGDPLVVDSALDNNGRLLALFSPRVNGYEINGVSNQILGFVTICDFFLRAECPSSNEGEAFYAMVPNPSVGWTVSLWRSLMRGTLIHEAKHIDSYAWRYFYEASFLEDVWLEEATAQQASEIWALSVYGKQAKQDLGYQDGPHCDYAGLGPSCPDPAEGILHHYAFLYNHYSALETKSILDASDPVIYGSSWAFMRYVTDSWVTSESAFLGSLVQVQNDHGVANVESKSGKSFPELFGSFSLAAVIDNYPGVTITDPKLKLQSWNSRDLFDGMNRFVSSGGAPAFPLAWPLRARPLAFGSMGPTQGEITQLKGGGFAAWELSGTQIVAQPLAIRSLSGGVAPAFIGMGIVRIQ